MQVVTLSRNFGKEAALLAGLDHARLGAVLFMDGDGQHPPDLVETLVARWLDDGYDVVYTAKAHRENEPWLRRTGVHWFYALINLGAAPENPRGRRRFPPAVAARGGGAAADAGAQPLLQGPVELDRLPPGRASITTPAPRAHGMTTWNVWTLIGLSIEGLTSFSVAPLRVASLLGLLLAAIALFFGIEILIETILFGKDVPGYPSLVVGMMVIGGVQLLMIGVLGEYIGKLLSEIKARPVYFVAEHSVKTADEAAKSETKPRPAASRAAE